MLNDDVKRGFSLGTFSFLFQLSNIGSGAEDLCIIIALGGEPGLQIQWVFCADWTRLCKPKQHFIVEIPPKVSQHFLITLHYYRECKRTLEMGPFSRTITLISPSFIDEWYPPKDPLNFQTKRQVLTEHKAMGWEPSMGVSVFWLKNIASIGVRNFLRTVPVAAYEIPHFTTIDPHGFENPCNFCALFAVYITKQW